MRAESWCGASMSLADHLATTIRLYLSRSRWFALASVEMAAILVVSTPPQNQPGHHAPGFFASTLRRIIADVHGRGWVARLSVRSRSVAIPT